MWYSWAKPSIIYLFELAIKLNYSPECGIVELSLPLFLSLSWTHQWPPIYFSSSWSNLLTSSSMNRSASKSSIFVLQKAQKAPKNGVEFRQGSIDTIRRSLATSYNVWRRRGFSSNQRPRNYLTNTESTYCQALLYEQRLQKYRRKKIGPYNFLVKKVSCLKKIRVKKFWGRAWQYYWILNNQS